jgi:hypothetical protein
VRIATSTRVTSGIVLGVVVGIGIWRLERPRSEERPTAAFDVGPPPLDLDLEPSSSSVQSESPAPPAEPFYASLFVLGATWTLPCTFGVGVHEDVSSSVEQRCHVDSVEVTAGETRARIACWFVKDPDVRDPNPAINTYVMTATGLYINDTSGEPIFTPDPVSKPLPKGWGFHEPRSLDGDVASAMVRHHGAWCRVDEFQGWDSSGGTGECISKRGIVGSSYTRDAVTQRCGDVP